MCNIIDLSQKNDADDYMVHYLLLLMPCVSAGVVDWRSLYKCPSHTQTWKCSTLYRNGAMRWGIITVVDVSAELVIFLFIRIKKTEYTSTWHKQKSYSLA